MQKVSLTETYRIFPILCLAAVAIFLPAIGSAQNKQFTVVDKQFLVSLVDNHGKVFVHESNRVPLIPNRACYGWRIRLSGVEGIVRFREIFSLPTQPEYWGGEGNEFSPNKITKDRRTSVTEKFATPDEGWIGNSWCVAEGDPVGRYWMEVSINNVFVERFEFDVVKLSSPSAN